jgi:hypothetical protein
MTKIIVDPGACGLTCTVEVEKVGKYESTVTVQSRCKQIQKLANEVKTIDFLAICRGRYGQNIVSECAARCGLHPSCPVPCAILKAIEGELGMAVKKDVTLTYEA